MKNSIIILTLCFIQSACASVDPARTDSKSMLSYQQIAAEISVRHELLEPETGIQTVTAREKSGQSQLTL